MQARWPSIFVSMKAITLTQYGSIDRLRVVEVAKPNPNPDQVLIQVHASTVNDWDWCLVRGTPFYIRLICGLLAPKVRIPGTEVAGKVVAAGRNVKKFRPGDEVYGDLSECGFGGWAEHVCAPESALALKPAAMSFAEAAAMPHAATLALQGLRDHGKLQAGQTLLINGAGGGVGTLALQIARSLGVKSVTGVDGTGKLKMMQALGFDHVVDYTREDFTRSGKRFDLILDTKTNRPTTSYLRALTASGIYVTVGGAAFRLLEVACLGPIIRRISHKDARIVALKTNQDLDHINRLYEAGKIKPVLDGPYKLDEITQALRRFGQGSHKGKIVVTVEHTEAASRHRD
jgi:NADPH:quinone reductase-like Zn-dependent oxidoreductase